MAKIRTVDFLPEIFQTPVNKQFLAATLDQLTQEPEFVKTQGFIGQKVGPGVNPADYYVVEPTAVRNNYQLEPSVVILDPTTGDVSDAITYPGMIDAINTQGGITNRADRLFESEYYTWDPFVDFDKLVNYGQYYWMPNGPQAVNVSPTAIPTTQTFNVTRANGVYTFSGVTGNNPILTLARNGQYQFVVNQNTTETENFRVSNRGTSCWLIDYLENPTLNLVRGNTYTFTLSLNGPYRFFFKTQASYGTTNLYTSGVLNNGAIDGTITFTVPYDAPDTLYYANDLEYNLRGQISITDPSPASGPGFWIQTNPGINGVVPWSRNISSRDVLGVTNNGTDLGTVQFNVPDATAQSFYTTMPNVGPVDLVVPPTLPFDQINGVAVSAFLQTYPQGIDGITSLDGRTLIFSTQYTNVEQGGWFTNQPFASTTSGYDTTPFAESTEVSDPAIQFGIWQVKYVTDVGGTQFIQLVNQQAVTPLTQMAIAAGTEYANTRWYKNSQGTYTQMPLLTADLPSVFYQDGTDPNIFGQIRLVDQADNDFINVNTSILGKQTYTSPNGVTFTNGLKVTFTGNVVPASYVGNSYYVQGVGSELGIQLYNVASYVTPEVITNNITNIYQPDYMTIALNSPDLNPWTRANRWFHVDVITAAAAYNNTQPDYTNAQRGRRPILEFRGGTRLFNFGTQGIPAVSIIDLVQSNALVNVAGQSGYSTNGYSLVNGDTIIFAADSDVNVRKQIYTVTFITTDIGTAPVIALTPTSYSPALADQTTVVLNGTTLTGLSYNFNGSNWIATQQKTLVNQPPLFDIYDTAGYSLASQFKYPSSNFKGTKLLSYAVDSSNATDEILGIPLAYFSLQNIGDILFDNNLYTDTFVYTPTSIGVTAQISIGYARQYSDRVTYATELGWQTAAIPSLSRQQFQFTYDGTPLLIDITAVTTLAVPAAQVYVNSTYLLPSSYTLAVNTTTNVTTITLNSGTAVVGDIIEVLVLSEQTSTQGFYQVPINLENNPFNNNSSQLTLGAMRSHYQTICENLLNITGNPVGQNNTRDLGNIIPYGQQILQQSSPMTLAGYFLRSPDFNVFAAIEYNSRQYIKFKNKLLTTVTQLNIAPAQSVSSILDQAMVQMSLSLTSSSPFYWSDMMPTGNGYTSSVTTVTPITTNTFNTNTVYDFTTSNYKGLLVYVNGAILLRGTEYVVNKESPKLTILVPLVVGDVVTINEYSSTLGNWIPNTPSKMGLYSKYKPEIYVDTTYSEPTLAIQGHDGSVTLAFGDIRDQVLLEFEKRVYNNIKVDDNPIPLSTDNVTPDFYPALTTALLPGFFRTTPYTYAEVNQIMSESFLSWVGQNNVDYTTQSYNPNNPFTYNYSQAANKINNKVLLGNWRGIYRYFYDTETPNITPWEMLGFSEMPVWWELRYGPAPYTDGNRVLWDDLEAGLVADPAGPYVLPEYIRPGLSNVIPAGSQGELLDPLHCVVGLRDDQGFQKSWVAGDGGPVQSSWWNSSSYPFAVMRMLALTKPAQFFSLFADRDLYRYDTTVGQFLYNKRYRINASELQLYGTGTSKASYVNWIIDYNRQLGYDGTQDLATALDNIDVRLTYRMASFTDSQLLDIYTERAGPSSTNNSLLLTPSSYNVLFYKNQPFGQITYSSVIVEVQPNGYAVYGYSNVQPYFTIQVSNPIGIYNTIAAGGLSVQVPAQYTQNTVQIPYGYTFTNTASVCDFLLGYGVWLESQGLIFDNRERGYTLNWNQMSQEFLYFAAQGWEQGTIINLNPAASTLKSSRPISIVDTIASITPENMLLDQNRTVLDVKSLIVERNGDEFSVTSTTGQTISFLTLKYTNYEDMIVFDNTSQYNDLLYDPTTGSRQNRLKLKAFTSTQWNGQLNAQGFILNLNNVEQWSPYIKYTKGQIVLYKNTYWSANDIVQPQEVFNYNNWTKSDYQFIDRGLLPNLALKADQLANTYDIYNANLDSDNDLFAYSLIGFRPRQYMSDMNLDGTTQVQIYQQFLGTKGTLRAAELFKNANLGKETGDYDIYENWAILAGTYGAQANRSFIEFSLNQSLLKYNPSTVEIINPNQVSQANQTVEIKDIWRTSRPITSTNIFPTTYENSRAPGALPTAGYVSLDDVDVTVFSIEDPTSIDANIDIIGIGTYIWIAKINSYDWGVYRVDAVPGQITQLSYNLNDTSIVQFNSVHGLSTGDLIIIKYFNAGVDGVYRVLATPTPTSVLISFTFTNTNVNSVSGTGLAFRLDSARVSQASDISTLSYVNSLTIGNKVWVDQNSQGLWETLEKGTPFVTDSTINPNALASDLYGTSADQATDKLAALIGAPGTNSGQGLLYSYVAGNGTIDYKFNATVALNATDLAEFGASIAIGNNNWAVVGAPGSYAGVGYAAVLMRPVNTSSFNITQLLLPPDQNFADNRFGESVAISTDERWMYVGSPGTDSVYTYARAGVQSQSVSYATNGTQSSFSFSGIIQITPNQPGQLLVVLNGRVAVLGQDYSATDTEISFGIAPPSDLILSISRVTETQLDYYFYSGVTASTTSGSGNGASFDVTVTRGAYSTIISNTGSGYAIGDTLTINGVQIGGTSSANNLVITVVTIGSLDSIETYTISGSGVSTAATFTLNTTLYTATNIDSFTVKVNDQVQRPHVDYVFNSSTTQLTFDIGSLPPAGAKILVTAMDYWQYMTRLSTTDTGSLLGYSLSTTTDGRQLFVGAPNATVGAVDFAGDVYVFDRGVINYVVTNTIVVTYAIPGSYVEPISVAVNNQFLLSTVQSPNGQWTQSGSNVVFTNITLAIGDVITIETNQFSTLQTTASGSPNYEAYYGSSLAACPLNCSFYVGSPFDSTQAPQAGSVDHQVNQSRVYGITTSTIANPTLTAGTTIRINDQVVTVPTDNTLTGLVTAIVDSGIDNVTASVTADLELVGDGSTKVFYIGSVYSSAASYTTRVFLNGVQQSQGFDYTYNASEENLYFLATPGSGSIITVVSGRLVISVINLAASTPSNRLTVLPGLVDSAFEAIGFDTFVLTQRIFSPRPAFYAQFGSSISVDTSSVNLIIGSPNGTVYEPMSFDGGLTYVDDRSTTFNNTLLNSGVAYTYDFFDSTNSGVNNPGQFAFGQQIYNSGSATGDKFATSVNYTSGQLLVGAPGGYATVFDNPNNTPAWSTIRVQQPVVDVYQLNSVYTYNKVTSSTQTYFDFFDPLQGKILGPARANLDYIGAVDPAAYNAGPIHNNGNFWGSEHVGQMWWDTDTVRFIDPNQDDIVYASRKWGSVFPGSRVDVYQWVESTTPPASYTGIGTPLTNETYTVGSRLGKDNVFQSLYYFWVRGITSIALGSGKTLSASGVASYIQDPRNSGLPYIAALNASTVAIYNAFDLLNAQNTILSVGYDQQLNNDNVHQEFQLIADGRSDAFLNDNLYRKMLDSLCGADTLGNTVPDPTLSVGERYGVQYRPRQSMFADRFMALENYLGRANTVLAQYPIVETRNFSLLNAQQPEPAANTSAWNKRVANLEELSYQNLAVVPVGYKYLVASDSSQQGRWTVYTVTLSGVNKTLLLTQVQSYDTSLYWYYVNWYEPGYNSTTAPVAAVQNYGLLSTLSYETAPIGSSVRVISNGIGKFEIYIRTGIDPATDWRRVGLEDGTIAFKEELWNYNVGNFGFDSEVFDSQYFDQQPTTETRYIIRALNEEIYVDDLILQRNSSLILLFNYIYSEFTSPEWLIKTSLVDVDHRIRKLLPYQTFLQDNQQFVEDYFNEVKPYHVQPRQFNLIYSADGINETWTGDATDFDVPAYWNSLLNPPQFVSPILYDSATNTPYVQANTPYDSYVSDTAPNAQLWLESPWSEWYNNYLLSVEGATIVGGGAGYVIAPVVTVTGTCVTQAIMSAIINGSGQVVSITVDDPGSGYSTQATITLSGGGLPSDNIVWAASLAVNAGSTIITDAANIYRVTTTGVLGLVPPTETTTVVVSGTAVLSFVGRIARAASQMGNNLIRNIRTTIKYDRCEYTTTLTEWAPNVVYTNGTQVRHDARVWEAYNSAGPTVTGSTFDADYWFVISADGLSGVDRTLGYYVPTSKTPGLSWPLLVDGIDYPGVQVHGPGFDQDTGFDVGNFDVNPFDNYFLDENGQATYDPAILDTRYASEYADIALGYRPTGINVDGGEYIDVFSSHAPEELIPGIAWDTVNIAVRSVPGGSWTGIGHGFPQELFTATYDVADPVISFADYLPYPVAIVITNITTARDLVQDSDYAIDWLGQTITMNTSISPYMNNGDLLGIYVYQLGGGNQLYKTVVSGATAGSSLVVPVEYDILWKFAIFVNGAEYTDFTFADNTGNKWGTTVINFGTPLASTDAVNITAMGLTRVGTTDVEYDWSLPLTQVITAQAGVLTYALTNSVEYLNPATFILTIAGTRVRTPAGAEYLGTGTTTQFLVPQRQGIDLTTITVTDVVVYINEVAQATTSYSIQVDVTGTYVLFNTAPANEAVVYISMIAGAQAYINTVDNTVNFVAGAGISPVTGDIIQVTTWNDTREQQLENFVWVGPISTVTQGFDTIGFDQGLYNNQPGSYDYGTPSTPTLSQGFGSTEFDSGNFNNEPGSFDYSDPANIAEFLADSTLGSKYLTNVSSFDNIGIGSLIQGLGLSEDTVITAVDYIEFLGDTSFGSNQITNINDIDQIAVGATVSGSGLPGGTTVVSIDSASSITVSNPAAITTVQSTYVINDTNTITVSTYATSTNIQTTYVTSAEFLGDTVDGSLIMSNVSSFVGIVPGTIITGSGINPGTVIRSIDTLTNTLVLSSAAVSTNTQAPYRIYNSIVYYNNLDVGRVITDPSRTWVSKNGRWLNPGVDYSIVGSEIILASGTLAQNDVVVATVMTDSVVPEASEFRIFQDMRGLQLTYRVTLATTTELTQDVTATADIIYVVDASALSQPDLANNLWGVAIVGGERIMYRERSLVDNTISSLLRGTAGTAAAPHVAEDKIYDAGITNLLSANEQNYIVGDTILANGTQTVYTAGNVTLDSSVSNTAVRVYVGGTLQTTGYTITSVAPVSITFTTAPASGSNITIAVRQGHTWYAPGDGTASNGQPLQLTNTAAARFLTGRN
jgi:hypothetical protein